MNIAVVIPVYLDADALPELLDRLFLTCARQAHDAEVILVDDGSANDTWQRLIAIRQANAGRRIILLRLAENRGQQAATICGLLHCSADVAITMDADLQHPPEEIPRLLEELVRGRFDLVYGIPAQRRHSLPRRASGLAFRTLTRPIGASAVVGSSFRAIRTAVTAELGNAVRRPFLSLDAFIRGRTDRIGRLKIDHAARRHGSSTYTWRTLLVTGFKELHYSGRSGVLYMMVGTLLVILGSLALLGETPGARTAGGVVSAESVVTLLMGAGATLLLAGGLRLRADGRPSPAPLFVLAEKIE